MTKIRVKLSLGTRGILSKIELGRHVEPSMNGNANFATPGVLVTNMATATTVLEAANGLAIDGGKFLTLNKRKAEATYDAAMEALANYVEGIANGKSDPTIALSAGFELSKSGGNRALLAYAIVASSLLSQEIKLRTGRVKISRLYRWEVFFVPNSWIDSPGPQHESDWTLLAETGKANFLATGLQSGTRYWFRMQVISSTGRSSYSTVINLVCL